MDKLKFIDWSQFNEDEPLWRKHNFPIKDINEKSNTFNFLLNSKSGALNKSAKL